MQTVHHDASQYEVIPPRPAPPLPFKHKYRVLAPGGQLLHRDFHTVTKQFITISRKRAGMALFPFHIYPDMRMQESEYP